MMVGGLQMPDEQGQPDDDDDIGTRFWRRVWRALFGDDITEEENANSESEALRIENQRQRTALQHIAEQDHAFPAIIPTRLRAQNEGNDEMKIDTNGIKLGMKVRCAVTGFEGIAYSVVMHMNGCVAIDVRPPVDKDGKMQNGKWLDVPQLEIVERKPLKVAKKPKKRGGPMVDSSSQGITNSPPSR